jgi:hypothetical protein
VVAARETSGNAQAMRDVTPVEALDVKLGCLMSARRMVLSSDATESDVMDAKDSHGLMTTAIPVAWTAKCFDVVRTAALSFPTDSWPTILDTDYEYPRLHICPGPILDGDGKWLACSVLSTDFLILPNGRPTLLLKGFVYTPEHRYWAASISLYVPVLASVEESMQAMNTFGVGLPGYTSRPDPRRRIALIRFALAARAFLDQRIAVESRASVDRPARRRAERLDVEPVVHVVRFRKAEGRAHGGDSPHDVEWSCQWLVRGHWRNQWHPRMQRHAPVWITPHIKGPADMPLKTPAPEVWQVAR